MATTPICSTNGTPSRRNPCALFGRSKRRFARLSGSYAARPLSDWVESESGLDVDTWSHFLRKTGSTFPENALGRATRDLQTLAEEEVLSTRRMVVERSENRIAVSLIKAACLEAEGIEPDAPASALFPNLLGHLQQPRPQASTPQRFRHEHQLNEHP